ncbi:phage tail protein [Citrobacter portucalensis]|uniref:phage tail-collar fiber domain-containing protein n=1 Tax=Citrobacter portucalensis TaxID=1639133 RepID=UPI001F3F5388|nr:phage tail protein [Citrobacter portucalensis]
MTTKYFAILTNQGAARLANATMLGTKLNITQMAVGDGNGTLPTPDPAQTKLINQTRIAPINSLSVDANDAGQIIAEQIIPENEGGFFIREIGLYDDDGILIAVANCPETYKPLLAEGSGRTQTIRMILVVSSTSAITLKIDPSVVLATRKYVDDAVIEVKSYVDGLMRNHEQSRNHPDATTTAKGFTQLNSSVTDDRETQSATPKAVKIAMDNANARLAKERNLADLPNPALARQNLQLGDSSTKNTGTTANTVAAGDDARITGAMQKSQNGADIPDVAKFLQNLGLGEGSALPVGVPVPWPAATPPTGWLKCNGAPFSAEEYPELAKAYPTNKLPDLRGEFIRGWDDGRGIDSGRGILTAQSHGMPSISGTFNGLFAVQQTNTEGCASVKKSVNTENVSTYYNTGSVFDYTFDTSGLIPASPELRPRNIAFNYIVRAA